VYEKVGDELLKQASDAREPSSSLCVLRRFVFVSCIPPPPRPLRVLPCRAHAVRHPALPAPAYRTLARSETVEPQNGLQRLWKCFCLHSNGDQNASS
jgi:hypothetical protein